MRIAKMQLVSSGHWRVRINGRCFYLGKDPSIAENKYRCLIAEHYGPSSVKAIASNISVLDLLSGYIVEKLKVSDPKWRKVKEDNFDQMKAHAIKLYGNLEAKDFGPKAYKSTRQSMAQHSDARRGTTRSSAYVNGLCSKLKAAFKWGVSEELIPVETYTRLQTVPDLKPGELGLTTGRIVKPVPESLYRATLPLLNETMADFLQLLWLSGARPGEILGLMPAELAQDGEYFIYRPLAHKTARYSKQRVIVFGKEAIAILRKYWPAEPRARFFHYSRSEVIRTAINRACKGVQLPCWHPYQLRHSAITRISLQHGKDVAQAVAGHSKSIMTDHYDDGAVERAKRAAG